MGQQCSAMVAVRSKQFQTRAVLILLTAIAVGGSLLIGMTPDARLVGAPLLALTGIVILFAVVVWCQDQTLSAFELGTFCMLTTAIYSIIPLLQFLMSGLTWTELSDNRFFVYQPGPTEIGSLGWRHVVYLGCFSLTYLLLRGKTPRQPARFIGCDAGTTNAVVLLFISTSIYLLAIQYFYGVNLNPSYVDLYAQSVGLYGDLPYFLQQVTHNLRGVCMVSKMALLVILLHRWSDLQWRFVLFAWLFSEVALVVVVMGARSEAALLVSSAFILYGKLVRPFTFKVVCLGGVFMLAVLIYGFARDLGGGLSAFEESQVSVWSANNEFQYMCASAYDLLMLKQAGAMDSMPLHYYLSDFYALIPSQFLPFEKADPSILYLNAKGVSMGSVLIGVIANSIAGADWIELVVRGILLGSLCGWIHRWYSRRSTQFWPTLFYLFLCAWSYYTFRASTFYVLYFVVYRFLPFMFLVYLSRGRQAHVVRQSIRRTLPPPRRRSVARAA